MKTMKNLSFLFVFAVMAITFSNCSKSNDPTPATQTNLQKVEATLTGAWTFTSMTITGANASNAQVTASVTNCTYPTNSYFKDTNWKSYVPEYKYVYSGGKNVAITDLCGGSTLSSQTVTATQNTDGTVKLVFSAGVNYTVNIKDVTSTTIKASVINSTGYTIIMTFAKS